MCIVSSWWGSELEIGAVWGCVIMVGGSVYRCGVFGNGDKVQFVELFGQVLCGGRLIS